MPLKASIRTNDVLFTFRHPTATNRIVFYTAQRGDVKCELSEVGQFSFTHTKKRVNQTASMQRRKFAAAATEGTRAFFSLSFFSQKILKKILIIEKFQDRAVRGRSDGWTDGQTDGRTDDGPTDGRKDRRVDGRTIGTGQAGSVTGRLCGLFRKLTASSGVEVCGDSPRED